MLYQDIITQKFSIPFSSIQVEYSISEAKDEIIIKDEKYIEEKIKEENDKKINALPEALRPPLNGMTLLTEFEINKIREAAPTIHHYVKYEVTEKPNHRPNQYIEEVEPVDGKQTWKVITKETTPDLLSQFKYDLKQRVTAKRWEVETSGLTLPNGIKVATKPEDQARLMSIIVGSSVTPIDKLNFKSTSGWVEVDVPTIKQIYATGVQFVQFCFNTEHAHHLVIDQLTDIDEIIDYDINTKWNEFQLS